MSPNSGGRLRPDLTDAGYNLVHRCSSSVPAIRIDERAVEPRPPVADAVDLVPAGHPHEVLVAGLLRVHLGDDDLFALARPRQDLAGGVGDRAGADEPEPALLAHPVDCHHVD